MLGRVICRRRAIKAKIRQQHQIQVHSDGGPWLSVNILKRRQIVTMKFTSSGHGFGMRIPFRQLRVFQVITGFNLVVPESYAPKVDDERSQELACITGVNQTS